MAWHDEQVEIMLELGFSLPDAEAFIADAEKMVPEGQDPATWTPYMWEIVDVAGIGNDEIQDARIEWYYSDAVPTEFKRLLDAKS